MMFKQDDCDTSLLCVPWDALSGRTDLTGAVQSCVKPCAADAECGTGRRCASVGLPEAAGAGRICVDEVAAFDEWCGGSRLLTSRVPGVMIQTGGKMVGCAEGLDCTIGTFGDVHVDEGICLQFCEANADCSGATPYCNPEIFTTTSSTGQMGFLGACSVAKNGPGAVCGSSDPKKLGLTSRCDTDPLVPDTVCVGVGGLFPDGNGFCAQTCAANDPCTGSENIGGVDVPYTCSAGFFTNGNGICNAGCTNYPDECTGDGGLGAGRFCMAYLGDDAGNPVGICMDRSPPPLAAATLDAEGNLLTMGDNCFGQGGSLRFTQCPDPAYCEILDFQQGVGICAYGCGVSTSSTTVDDYCPTLLNVGTATCATVFTNMGNPVTDIGLCGNTP